MKNAAIAAIVLFCSLKPALASVDPALQQLLISAKQKVDLSYNQTTPFQMDVDFVIQLAVPTRGHLTLKWEAKDRWWRGVVIEGFQQIEVKNGEWHYTSRNLDYTPMQVVNLIGLLDFDYLNLGGDSGEMIAKKGKQRTEAGVEMNCIQVERKGNASRNVCFDAASNDILVVESKEHADWPFRVQYSDYFDFGIHRYPHKLEWLEGGSKVVSAKVVSLISAPFDESLLTPPQGAIARRECEGMTGAFPIKTVGPSYPKSASSSGLMGDTTVAMTILTDGTVTNIHIVGRATRSMDDAALKALKEWRFKPAMCGTEPVVTDTTVMFGFRMSY